MKHMNWVYGVRVSRRYLSSCFLLLAFMAVQAPASSTAWTARLVKDIDPSGDAHPRFPTRVGDTVFFTVHARELWKTDGTEAGTVMLKQILPAFIPDVSSPFCDLTSFNGSLFFMDFDGTSFALGRSDGTPAGTLHIKDLGTNWIDMLASDGILWVLSVGGTESALWKSNGTTAGTVQVKSFTFSGGSYGYCLGVYRGLVYFTMRGVGDTVWRLWRSNGTLAGTTFVKDLPYAASSGQHPRYPYVVNDRLLFFTEDASGVIGLWISDGTDAGTQLLRPIMSGICQDLFYPAFMAVPVEWDQWTWSTAAGNALVFGAYDATSSSVWKTDGTPAGTVKLMDVGGPPSSSSAVFPLVFTDTGDGVAFFICSWDAHAYDQYSLWKTDASLEHATQVKAFPAASGGLTSVANVGGTLFFGMGDGSTGNRIWTSDGTEAGTRLLQNVVPASGGRAPYYFTNVNGRVYCSANSAENGQELWVCEPGTPPTAAFFATPTSGPPPLTVQFTDLSIPGTSPIIDHMWEFGDGGTSHEVNPSHIYDQEGAYTVTLTVSADQDSDAMTRTWYIEVGNVLPATAPAGMGLLAIALLAAGTSVLRASRLRSPGTEAEKESSECRCGARLRVP